MADLVVEFGYNMQNALLIFCLLIATHLFAQTDDATVTAERTGIISGRVIHAETGSPLEFTDVFLDSLPLGNATDNLGNFLIRYVPPGTHTLVVKRLGFIEHREEVTVSASRLISRDIGLKPTQISGEEVVVTATRREQTAQMAPASVALLTAEDVAIRPVTTFDQILESVPGVAVFRSAGVSVQSLSIRGSSDVAGGGVGNRVLLLIDGRPALTAEAGGAYWGLVPTNFVERVEVVKGAFSSLYGSTAMGGVVNVITRRPTSSTTTLGMKYGFFEKSDPVIRYTEEMLYQSELELSHSGIRGPVSYLFNVSRKQSDGHATQTAYEFYDVFSKLLFDLNLNRNLELTVGGGWAENDYPHSWLNAARPLSVRPSRTDNRQEKRQFNVDAHYWAVPGNRSKYSSRFYWYRNTANSFFNENDPNLEITGNEPLGTETLLDGDKVGNISQFDMYLNDKNYLIAGIDLQLDHVDSSPDTILYGRQQVNNGALYLQNETEFSKKFTATIGMRYDVNHLVGGKTLKEFSPKVSLLYAPVKTLSLRGLFGQAFRAPTISERFFEEEIGGGIDFVPNPDLDAERMDISLEAGMRWQVTDFADLDAAWFYYQYENLIYWKDIGFEQGAAAGTVFQVQNLNRALLQGIELTGNLRYQSYLSLGANYTWLNAKDQSEDRLDDILAYRPEHSLNLSATANYQRLQLHVNGRFRSEIEEVFLFPPSAPEAFWVWNSKLNLGISDMISASVTLNNIFDSQYEELARYRMPGRNWLFGISLRR